MSQYLTVTIHQDSLRLPGDLTIPQTPRGLVLFSHGSGSSRKSPRNRYVAGVLNDAGIATLLFDLLTPEEDTEYETRFDIDLLTERLLLATRWCRRERSVADLPYGYFGASTGAASAIRAAAVLGHEIKAVVSRGGRPDLAGDALREIDVPTLLLVGGADTDVIRLNREALQEMNCERQIMIIPGATHLFEEPGTLERVAQEAAKWFGGYMGGKFG